MDEIALNALTRKQAVEAALAAPTRANNDQPGHFYRIACLDAFKQCKEFVDQLQIQY